MADGSSPAANDSQKFWNGISKLPERAGRSFWDAGITVSVYLGENPSPQKLVLDTSAPPPGMPWYERIFFYIGQSSYNQGVAQLAAGQQMAEGAQWLGTALKGDFNKSPTTGQVIVGGIISLIPIVDQACDVRDIAANCITLTDEKEREDWENWLALGLTCLGFVPEIGSAVKTVGKVVFKEAKSLLELLKVMEHLEATAGKIGMRLPWGRAPIEWLRKYDWIGAAKAAAATAKQAFLKAESFCRSAATHAISAFKQKLLKLAETFRIIASKIVEALEAVSKKIKDRLEHLLPNAKKETGNYSAESGGRSQHSQKQRVTKEIIEARRKLANDFYLKQGYDPKRINSHLDGIDFNKPVEVTTIPKGTDLVQYQVPGSPQGNYYAPPGTPTSSLGISPQGKDLGGNIVDKVGAKYVTTSDVEVLQSTAAPIKDTWSVPGQVFQADGGGTQFMTSAKDAFTPGH